MYIDLHLEIMKRRWSYIKSLPIDEQPREKLIRHGVQNLSNSELLAIILRVGNKKENVLELSRKILNKFDINKLSNISYNEVKKFKGINKAKSCQILACFELARRLACFQEYYEPIKKPRDIFKLLHPYMRNLKQEQFIGVYLNKNNYIIRREIISIGTLDVSLIHPRDVFKHAITDGATSVILVHNHPSGNPKPSKNDIIATEIINKGAGILGLKILDHIIIGNDGYFSFMEDGQF
jgi:DNA repair protein RadC